jgi:chemotaxis protein MotB
MARRRYEEEHENHERWLVSYADFITLLFAFFVVMYSLSSINEGKYRVLSDSIVQAFRSVSINSEGNQVVLPPIVPVAMPLPTRAQSSPARTLEEEAKRAAELDRAKVMEDEIRRALAPLERDGQVTVGQGAHGLSVEINAKALFASGDATLGQSALGPLQAVAQVVAAADFPIIVEGHTDTTPISTYRFPSNWELSAARASSVVRMFVEAGVVPGRLTAAGYGDQRPVASNDSEAGRSRNRRVKILMESMSSPVEERQPAPSLRDDPLRAILPEGGAR